MKPIFRINLLFSHNDLNFMTRPFTTEKPLLINVIWNHSFFLYYGKDLNVKIFRYIVLTVRGGNMLEMSMQKFLPPPFAFEVKCNLGMVAWVSPIIVTFAWCRTTFVISGISYSIVLCRGAIIQSHSKRDTNSGPLILRLLLQAWNSSPPSGFISWRTGVIWDTYCWHQHFTEIKHIQWVLVSLHNAVCYLYSSPVRFWASKGSDSYCCYPAECV